MKAVIRVGWDHYITDADKALLLSELLSELEVYKEEYHRGTADKPGYTTYHVYPREPLDMQMKLVTEDMYRAYKLAGEPSKD